MYDSTIYCVRQLQARGNHEPTGILLKAKAYSFLGVKDSAVIYAEQAVQCTNSLFDLNNAYYILANEDATKDKEEALQCTRDRADIQKLIEIRQGQLSQATQLLEQDLTRKPNLTWLWATLATLCIIATSTSIYVRKKKAKHQLISQQVEALQQTRDSLSAQTRQIENEQKLRHEKMLAEIELFCNSITEENMKKELCWIDFTQMCTIVNQRMFGLVDKLKARGITSMTEIRICVLLALDRFNAKQMANVIPCTYDSFKTTKSLIVKKLNVSRENIHSYLINLAVGG
jgi:tetratricopeptide (TPR) repeat protein